MHEDVGAGPAGIGDETETLLVVEPFDYSLGHADGAGFDAILCARGVYGRPVRNGQLLIGKHHRAGHDHALESVRRSLDRIALIRVLKSLSTNCLRSASLKLSVS